MTDRLTDRDTPRPTRGSLQRSIDVIIIATLP